MVKKKNQQQKTEREKVEERREEVLARGRKFRYPLQYAKHRMVIYTIVIAAVALVALSAVGWFMLYRTQNTSDLLYRITQIIPVSVAEVDGEPVRYSDYLMIYRSNLQAAQQQSGQLSNSEEDEQVRNIYKNEALSLAIEYTYAIKLAKDHNISVANEEINQTFDEHRRVGGTERSKEAFLRVVRDNFDMNESEYRRMLYLSLIKSKVSQVIDTNALAIANRVDEILAANDNNYVEVAAELGESILYEATGQLVDNMNIDGGRSNKAMTLEIGQSSERFLSSGGDSYYYVKLIDKTESTVNYESLQIIFTEFDQKVAEVYADGKVEKSIQLDEN